MVLHYFKLIQILKHEVHNLNNELIKCKNMKGREVIKKQITEFETLISNYKKITDDFLDRYNNVTLKKIIIDYYYNDKGFKCAIDFHAPYEDDENDEDDEDKKYERYCNNYYKKMIRHLSKL